MTRRNRERPTPPADPGSGGPIAYLTGEYPKVSHTFIQREIAALREKGQGILACTVRRPSEETVVGPDQKSEATTTFCILDVAKKRPDLLVAAHVNALIRAPRRWLRAAVLAWRTRPPGLKALAWQLFYFAEAGLLADHLRRKGVVHLHNHFSNSSCSVAMLTSVMSDIPFSFTIHGPSIFYEPRWWRIDEKIARAKFVVCISFFARSQAMLFSDRGHWNKLKIVHCGVIPANYGRREKATYGKHLVFVGRLAAIKGVPLLIEAFAAARSAHHDARLTLVGDGPDRLVLEERVEALGLQDAVTFAGYQPQDAVANILDNADIFVLPSFAEGVPVVLMEAMASRLPVVSSRVAGVPELVEDGISGFLVSPGDTEALADRIVQLLSDPERCARMGEAGRRKVEAEFDVGNEAASLYDLFKYGADDE